MLRKVAGWDEGHRRMNRSVDSPATREIFSFAILCETRNIFPFVILRKHSVIARDSDVRVSYNPLKKRSDRSTL
jgi:hypothetical protein